MSSPRKNKKLFLIPFSQKANKQTNKQTQEPRNTDLPSSQKKDTWY